MGRLDGPERELGLLVDHREDLVGVRTLYHPCNLARLAERLAGVEGTVARIARDLVERCSALTTEIKST